METGTRHKAHYGQRRDPPSLHGHVRYTKPLPFYYHFNIAKISTVMDRDGEEFFNELSASSDIVQSIEEYSNKCRVIDYLLGIPDITRRRKGYTDANGRPVLEFEDESSRREALSVKEVSSFLLYLARLPRIGNFHPLSHLTIDIMKRKLHCVVRGKIER
ncbi:hypothetical protein WN51_09325 [Melipona quadrifasciata]|uniref:Uncharacterized protein n=1 Tax=Melipona quadrifasciata TaxID=166423 RepID=A0A0M9A5J1_9HYME|nr:hypothetical protein WN51_09325 [Melipona quadrifasciata]